MSIFLWAVFIYIFILKVVLHLIFVSIPSFQIFIIIFKPSLLLCFFQFHRQWWAGRLNFIVAIISGKDWTIRKVILAQNGQRCNIWITYKFFFFIQIIIILFITFKFFLKFSQFYFFSFVFIWIYRIFVFLLLFSNFLDTLTRLVA